MSFASLNLHPSIQKALEACNYSTPTPIQAKAIPEILAGRDVVASAQTGTGKTAAFVLPSLHYLAQQEPSRKPRVLILTPTRELASQITKAAIQYGKFMRFNIISLVGGMSYEPQIRDLKRGADIIVATPGRLIDHMENHRVDLSQIEILVLDEADRMLDMGFIEDVEKIAAQSPGKRQTLLFSATVDKSLAKVIARLLKNPVNINLSQEQISAPRIKQSLYKAKNMQHKSRMLKHLLNDENIYKAIIFTATKQLSDRLANELRADGFAAAPLHGDLRQNVRNRTIDGLRRGKIQFLIATDVAARGLDISDITHVINFDLPKFSEDYVHRIGRTGRAGKEGEAISFFTSQDMKHLQRIEKYIGMRLTIQQDRFEYAEASVNTRNDAEQFSPEKMFENEHRGKPRRFKDRRFDDKPRSHEKRRFDDKPRSQEKRHFDDKPRSHEKRRFDDDKPRSHEKRRFDDDKPRSHEKRHFDDKPRSQEKHRFDDKPRSHEKRRFDDKPRSQEKRRFDDKPRFEGKPKARSKDREFNVFERPVYEFEQRDDNPKVRYKKRVEKSTSDRSDKPKFKHDLRSKRTGFRTEGSEQPTSSRNKKSGNFKRGNTSSPGKSILGGKNTKRPYRDTAR